MSEKENKEVIFNTESDYISKSQIGINSANNQDIAYIKGLLYSMISRIGSLEDSISKLEHKFSDVSSNQDDINDKQSMGQFSDNQIENPTDPIEPEDNVCHAEGTVTCNTTTGEWEKGTFSYGCGTGAQSRGWYESTPGKEMNYTIATTRNFTGSSGICNGVSADTNCALSLFGLFSVTEMPDDWLNQVKDMARNGVITICQKGGPDPTTQPKVEGYYAIEFQGHCAGSCGGSICGTGTLNNGIKKHLAYWDGSTYNVFLAFGIGNATNGCHNVPSTNDYTGCSGIGYNHCGFGTGESSINVVQINGPYESCSEAYSYGISTDYTCH